MSVVVSDSNIDLALRLLWREANKEGILQKLEEIRYYIPKSVRKHERNRKFEKIKKRRRQFARKQRQKNLLC